ncbi:metallopeptidase family protein [Peptoniphilus asaccharolyticus]
MVEIDEFQEILEELYEELPEEIYEGLNGGIILEEECKYYENEFGLICLGVYERGMLGRCIRIYYGSFMNMYSWYGREDLKNEVRKTLHHELTHHIEFLAKDNDLEIEDIEFLKNYRESKENG